MSWSGPEDFLERLHTQLFPAFEPVELPIRGDFSWHASDLKSEDYRSAGVLIGVVDRGAGDLNVVLTERPKTMPTHPGQVAFPGGKVDPSDADSVEAALREAKEEVGVNPVQVDIRGVTDLFYSRTGFKITPVVGLLPDDFVATPDPYEVDDVFETPLSFLMNPDNHIEKSMEFMGKPRTYLEMPHNGRRIWGVTASVIRGLYERLYVHDPI